MKENRFQKLVGALFLGLLSGLPVSSEVLLGVSPRNSSNGPYELARWEGRSGPRPEGWAGSKVDLIGFSLGGAQHWGSLAEYGVYHLDDVCRWETYPHKENFELSVPMFPSNWKVGAEGWRRALLNDIPGGRQAHSLEDATERYHAGGWEYLAYFGRLAEKLVEYGYQDSIIRLGWEYNGDWFEWGYAEFEPFTIGREVYTHPRAYREVFQKIREAMLAVEGANFRFSWCASIGARNYADEEGVAVDYRDWYPGRKAVDIVSVDYFDDEARYYLEHGRSIDAETQRRLTWLTYLLQVEGIETSLLLLLESIEVDLKGEHPWAAREFTNEQLMALAEKFESLDQMRAYILERELGTEGRPGVQWFRDFAKENGHGFLVSEWGVWESDAFEDPQSHFTGGDNAEFIKLFHSWLYRNEIPGKLYGALYFEEYNDLARDEPRDGFNHSLLDGDVFPKARAAFGELFQKGQP